MRTVQTRFGIAALAGLLALGATVAPASAQEETEQQDPTVELVVATAVEGGEPIGEAETFPADVGEVFAWLGVEDGQGEILEVVWTHGEQETVEQVMIRENPGHEWTAMAIPTDATGEWTVQIRYQGSVLTSSTFTVG